MEVLNRLLDKAKEELLKGIILGRNENQLEASNLFFADITLNFC